MTYQDELEAQAESVSDQVLAALAAYAAGTLTADALAAVVSAFIAAGNNGAAALADLSLAAAVTTATGTPAAPLGIGRPADDPARLARAVSTILTDLDRQMVVADADLEAALTAAQTRFQRLAQSEVKEAGARAYSEGVRRSRRVTGWTRGLSGSACQLCRWWSRDGRVWDADHTMPTHKGCTCSQIITTRKEAAT